MPGFKKNSRIYSLLVLFVLLVTIFFAQPIAAAEYSVCPTGCTYATIQSAVNAASSGDTILVGAGTYHEHVVIGKTLTLIGTDAVIDGNGLGIVALVTSPDVSISGFTVQNSGTNPGADAGIGVVMADGVHIFNNILAGNAGGVSLAGATNSLVENNQFTGNIIGVALAYYENSGLVFPSTGNNIQNNNILNSMHSAIYGDKDCSQNSITGNTITSSLGVADGIYLWKSSNNTISGNSISGNPQYGIHLMGSANNVISNNVISANLDGIRIRVSSWPEGAYPSFPNTIEDNKIFGNINYDLFAETDVSSVDAAPNYWGVSCSAPQKISGAVEVSPWYLDEERTVTYDGLATALAFPTGASQVGMNALIACAKTEAAITFGDPGYAYPGGLVVPAEKSDLIFLLNGATIGAGSPAFIIEGDDVTIQGPGVLDGGGSSTDAGVLVRAGADNFILDRVEVTGWRDGLELEGSVTSFKLVSNWFHDNTESGLQVNSGVALGGVVTVEGNLFKENGATGIQNDGSTSLNAAYNSWGHIDGPAAGDTVSANVNTAPYNYFEIFMDVEPDTDALTREILEGDTVDVKVKLDAKNIIYGLSTKLSWDATLLELNSVTFDNEWLEKCDSDSLTPGEITVLCYLREPAAEYSAVGSSLLTLNMTTLTGASLSGNGPWTALFDLSHLESDTSVGAIGGAKVWVNNAGYGAPSVPERDISDADDGRLIITGLANYSGMVLLEGRSNRSGALVRVFNIADKATSLEMANATSAATGAYTTAHISPNVLILGTNYYLFIDRPLYLPTTIMGVDLNLNPDPVIPSTWGHSKLLTTRLYTPLATVTLRGGDATNDNVIDILDAGCIGADYYLTPGVCGTDGSSDVNGDGVVDMVDLTLMSGNYTFNYSPWSP